MSAGVSIMIFARAPVPGQCKTRLIPELGADGAAELHMQLVQHTLRVAIESCIGPVSLWCAPDIQHPFFAGCARSYGVHLQTQCDGDIGARMLHAFEWANGPALLAGSATNLAAFVARPAIQHPAGSFRPDDGSAVLT